METLVRVGLEKEAGLSPDSKMVVLHDFTPCVDDELAVKRGQIVNVLYQENDWVYVLAENNQEGFVPYSYCTPYGSPMAELALNIRKKMPRAGGAGGEELPAPTIPGLNTGTSNSGPEALPSTVTDSTQGGIDAGNTPNSGGNYGIYQNTAVGPGGESGVSPNSSYTQPFYKDACGRYLVLYTFIARDENDLSVERGELVTAMNKDDPDWYWVLRSDGQEGFVPSNFICPYVSGQTNNNNNVDVIDGGSGEKDATKQNEHMNVTNATVTATSTLT